MNQRLEGKSILVAGAGAIGGALAARYAGEGASVTLGDINLENAQNAVNAIHAAGGEAQALFLDGADDGSIAAAVETACAKYGGLDGAHINFARFADTITDTIVDLAMDKFDDSIRVNIRGFALCTRHIVPALQARGGGSIVYTSSSAAYIGDPGLPVYAISKSAIQALMRHVASRYGPEGIRANCIAPGLILHPRLEKQLSDAFKDKALGSTSIKSRLGRPDDIAAVGALLMSDEGSYLTGQVINVDGGATMRS